MPRLVVNPDGPCAWIRELSPGEFSLGRGPENDVVIEHPSVSSAHCRLQVANGQATLTDLGSVSGTFVGSELVEQAALRSGAVFMLGEVAIRFEAEETVPQVPPSGTPTALGLTQSEASCEKHPRARATHSCPKCRKLICSFCLRIKLRGSAREWQCRTCGSVCEPLPGPPEELEEISLGGFSVRLLAAFKYPLRGNGIILIISGGVLFAFLGLVPAIGLLVSGYIFNYAMRIVCSTAIGEEEPPDWPDLNNIVDDILLPYWRLIALVVMTIGPALLLFLFFPENALRLPLIIFAGIVGLVQAPMGMLALAMFDTVSALNPIGLVTSILRIPGPYFVTLLIVVVPAAAYALLENLLMIFLPFEFTIHFISGIVNLYFLAVAMRILGLLYATHQQRLKWFTQVLA